MLHYWQYNAPLKQFIRYRKHIDADMPRLSENERNEVLWMLMVGATKQHIANAFGHPNLSGVVGKSTHVLTMYAPLLRQHIYIKIWPTCLIMNTLVYAIRRLKPSEGGFRQLEYDVKDNWRPHGFRNTMS